MLMFIYLIIGLLVGGLVIAVWKRAPAAKVEASATEIKPEKKKLEKTANPAISSERLKLGNNIYLFEVKQSRVGNKYLKLSEVWTKDGKEVNKNIIVFREHLEEFSKILDEMKKRI